MKVIHSALFYARGAFPKKVVVKEVLNLKFVFPSEISGWSNSMQAARGVKPTIERK
jgi:hypothetical protein